MGPIKGIQQGLRPTKKKGQEPFAELEKELSALKKEYDMYTTIIDLKETMYTDQTGKFPYLSSQGNRYVMVGVHVDATYIFQERIKTKLWAKTLMPTNVFLRAWKPVYWA